MPQQSPNVNQASPEAQRQAKIAAKGSQRWLQIAVRNNVDLLDDAIQQRIGGNAVPIEWLSPIEQTRYGEYRGQAFLKLLGLNSLTRPIADFWPERGPMWDGLAKSGKKVLLVEAKGHIAEMVTSPVRATAKSLAQIRKSMEETRISIAPHTSNDWTGIFYQYTNRLAHLYFLRTVNRVDAQLIFIYFVNARDVGGPGTVEEWHGAIRLMKSYMGLHRHKLSRYVHDVFIDVDKLRAD